MAKGDHDRCIFPISSLQIGDLQSYFADLGLFLANDSKRIYILVDNRPWLSNLGSGVHFWQLMVTKSRLSPFVNTKARRERKEEKEVCSGSNTIKPKKFQRWFSAIDEAILSRKRVLLPVENLRNALQFSSELHRTLYGFIVFEIAWKSVRGINYYTELQTDTTMAIETKVMQRWEFDSITHAASCISSWFSGTPSEQLLLKEHLHSAVENVFYDASEDFCGTIPIDDDDNICNGIRTVEDSSFHCLGGNIGVNSENIALTTVMPHTPPPSGPYKRRKVMMSSSPGAGVDSYSEELLGDFDKSLDDSETSSCTSEDAVEATQHRDVLILFRFDDRDLPFKLRDVIISDLRLLALLEAGLPSWVIFLQSYPVLCHIYRPWMCPLARVLYVIISLVTVLIGFYDLYKNVPVLKATASRICGPLFDWIEDWDMLSRIKYLGTMLFLHHFQKALRWCLALTHATRSFFSVLVRPLVELFGFMFPVLNLLFALVEDIFSVVWYGIGTFFNLVGDLLELLFSPLWFLFSVILKIATSIIYPIFWILWEILYAPIRLVLGMSNFLVFVCTCICKILGNAWQLVSSLFQLASSSEATVSSHEMSMWRSLWNDLFSQIFRAVRSILYGFAVFFAACNRHRLSIYNHLREFVRRLYHQCQRSPQADLRMVEGHAVQKLLERLTLFTVTEVSGHDQCQRLQQADHHLQDYPKIIFSRPKIAENRFKDGRTTCGTQSGRGRENS